MRVTERTNFDVARDSIARSKGRMEKLQFQASTLKKLNAPSDDPTGAAKIMEMRTDKVNNDQFVTNAKLAEMFLSNTDHALGEIGDLLIRAKEIALGQASGASSNESTRLGIAEEVEQLYQQAVAAGNRRIGDRYLFSGYKVHTPAITPDGNYTGDDGQIMTEIAKDVFLAINIPGHEAFNTNPSDSADINRMQEQGTLREPASTQVSPDQNINIFNELKNLRISLLTGDLEGIRTTLERFDDLHGQVMSLRAKVGSRIQGLVGSMDSAERQTITSATLSSNLEDADMAEVLSNLAKEETVFRSALSSSKHLIQPTLLDFLK